MSLNNFQIMILLTELDKGEDEFENSDDKQNFNVNELQS